jgi:hypothetical protein
MEKLLGRQYGPRVVLVEMLCLLFCHARISAADSVTPFTRAQLKKKILQEAESMAAGLGVQAQETCDLNSYAAGILNLCAVDFPSSVKIAPKRGASALGVSLLVLVSRFGSDFEEFLEISLKLRQARRGIERAFEEVFGVSRGRDDRGCLASVYSSLQYVARRCATTNGRYLSSPLGSASLVAAAEILKTDGLSYRKTTERIAELHVLLGAEERGNLPALLRKRFQRWIGRPW